MLYALASLFYWVILYAPLPQVLQPLILLVDLAPRWLVFLPLLFVGSGFYAVLYQFKVRDYSFPLVNIHLHTSRWMMLSQKAPITNYRNFQRLYRSYFIESMLASALVQQDTDRAVIGGDFNLTQQSGRYQQYWTSWQNCFDVAGKGLGRTYHMGLLAVRIDHVLAGEGWRVLSSRVHPSMGGDHNPVVAELTLR